MPLQGVPAKIITLEAAATRLPLVSKRLVAGDRDDGPIQVW